MCAIRAVLKNLLDPMRDGCEWLFISSSIRLSMLIIILVLLSIGVCMAENIQFCADYPLNFADWSENASLQKFDSRLGELTGAQIRMNLTLEHDIAASNKRDMQINVSMDTGANLSLQLPNKECINIESANNWTFALKPNGEKSFNESYERFKTFSVDPEQLRDFIGSSSGDRLNLPVQVKTASSFASDGASGYYIITRAGASVCIVYEYVPNSLSSTVSSKDNSSDQSKSGERI